MNFPLRFDLQALAKAKSDQWKAVRCFAADNSVSALKAKQSSARCPDVFANGSASHSVY